MNKNKLLFFVNGCMIYNNGTYTMRFLTENERMMMCELDMIIKDESGNKKSYKRINVDGITTIKIDCTEFMEKYNWLNKTYMRLTYTVKIKNEEILNGSFPLISNDHHESLKYICVSCNAYEHGDYIEPNLWDCIANKQTDIILHIGEQIRVKEDKTGIKRNIYDKHAELYKKAYSSQAQQTAMRNTLNMMMMNSDIYGGRSMGMGNNVKTNVAYKPYYEMGMLAYLDYQAALTTDITDEEKIQILEGDKPIYYVVEIGKYAIIMMDERNELYHKHTVITDEQIEWIECYLDNTIKEHVIIVSPRPIGNMNTYNARIKGWITNNGLNELSHPKNNNRTVALIEMLDKFRIEKKMIMVSGDIRKTYMNTITDAESGKKILDNLVTSGITSRPRGYEKMFTRILYWLESKLPRVSKITGTILIGERYMESNNSNYGYIEEDSIGNYYVEEYDVMFPWLNTI